MQTRITSEEMAAAARQLAKTETGRQAMKHLVELLEGDSINLDFLDRRAFLALLGGAWSGQADKMREIVDEALANGAKSAT